jgi:hypothetical protein
LQRHRPRFYNDGGRRIAAIAASPMARASYPINTSPDHRPMPPVRIERDGTWSFLGLPMVHETIVPYLKRCLRRDRSGRYWLVAGEGRVPVEVDDVPYQVVGIESGRGLRLVIDDGSSEPMRDPFRLLIGRDNKMYCRVKRGHHLAAFSRGLHHWLWNRLLERDGGAWALVLDGQEVAVELGSR